MATVLLHAWRNVLLNVVINRNLSLLPRVLLLKDLLLLLSAVFAWALQVTLISHNLLLADALVRALLGRGVAQNWSSFVLITGKLRVIASSLWTFILVLDLRQLKNRIVSSW